MLKRYWSLPKPEMCRGMKADELADILESRIVTNNIPVGMRIPPEREIAEECGINRATVQKAIQLLEQRGLVEMLHGSGTYVKDLEHSVMVDTLKRYFVHTRSTPEHMFSLRLFLESGAASLAASSATDQQVKELRTCFEEFEDAINGGDDEKRVEADLRFHEMIAEATGNPMLMCVMKSLHKIIFLLMTDDSVDRIKKAKAKDSIQIHRAILEAIADRNPELADQMMKKHMNLGKLLLRGEAVDLLSSKAD